MSYQLKKLPLFVNNPPLTYNIPLRLKFMRSLYLLHKIKFRIVVISLVTNSNLIRLFLLFNFEQIEIVYHKKK